MLGLIKKFPLEWNVIFFPGESAPRQMKIGVNERERNRELTELNDELATGWRLSLGAEIVCPSHMLLPDHLVL